MSETRAFLLELHCEEIPARFLKPLLEDGLLMKLEDKLEEWHPTGDGANYGKQATGFISPRKITVIFSGIPVQQLDQSDIQVGPPQRMCLDDKGQPTVQGLKFAEKWGLDFSAVRFEQPAGKKEPCAVVTLTKKGRPTLDLLSEALPRLISELHVPKAMRWGTSEFEFVRPIRNLLCLFGDEVVPFAVDGVTTSRTTWGHRLHHLSHPEPITISSIEAYEAELEQAGVVVSFQKRRETIAAAMDKLAGDVGGRVVTDADLLDTLAAIVEYPHVVLGQFPATFMALPKEVLVTSLKEHQKSFCIENEKGELLPYFLAAANRPDDPAGFIKSGNEWVLKSRLYDARFFFEEDRRTPLAERLDSLTHLTFHRELGSYFEKTERIAAIATSLAKRLGHNEAHANAAARACKCDLRTLMVGEFPELQGIMGGEYLRHEQAPEPVWMAVKEHYQPVGAEAPIPTTDLGCVLAVADKLDTLAGCFAIGQIPSGSKDPLALRRAGVGIVRILWEKGWPLSPMELCRIALKALGSRATKPESDTLEALESFFRDRVAYQLEVAAYAGAVRRSALPVGWANLVDLKSRCEALSSFAEDPRFGSLAQSAKRIGNILKDEVPSDDFETGRLQESEEKILAGQLARMEAATDHSELLTGLAELAEPLEAFFNAVMVKCEDLALRNARLSLLHRLRKVFLRVADFSLWQ